mmetsp:Transcript_1995/g.6036  ORF Transcript_1995/g.6036 Transcript_1995/m.6036 type:complete len:91 (-) Transcript_1995:377-649(-)
MDFVIGNATYLLPFIGEGFDLIWGPVQAVLMGAMFDKVEPNAKWFGLLEEVLPMTDVIPSASLTWLKCHPEYYSKYLTAAKELKEKKKKA